MVMMEAPDHFNSILSLFITRGITKPSANYRDEEEDRSNNSPGDATFRSEKDKTTRTNSPWFSPRKKRPDSSKSSKSISSIKSSKSRKSMPKGVLTHSLLWALKSCFTRRELKFLQSLNFLIESLVFANLPVIILLKGLCSYFYTFNSESCDI